MLGMIFTIVGIIVMVLTVLGYVLPRIFGEPRQNEKTGKITKGGLPLYAAVPLFGLGLCIMFGQGAVYYAEPGHSYLVQYPTGTQVGELTPGYHMKWWGTAEPFKKFITVKAAPGQDNSVSASIPSIEARFTDAVTADVDVTARFQLPANPDKFLALAISFRTQDNLETSTLVPVLREVVRNSARTMTAQDYIAGKGGEFENAILDQLREGTYILDIKEITPEGQKTVTEDDARVIDQSQMVKYEVRKMLDMDGNIRRKDTALVDYSITVTQSNVSNVDPEQKFKDMLALQRDAAAQASVKKQEAKRAEYDKQKIIAEGEASKAGIKVKKEQEQIEILITAETAKKEQQIALEESKLRLQQVEVDAKARKTAADAEAYEKKAVMLADGALSVKADIIKHVATVSADAWSRRPVPQTIIGGAGGEQGSPNEMTMFMQLMLRDLASKQLNLDMTVNSPQK